MRPHDSTSSEHDDEDDDDLPDVPPPIPPPEARRDAAARTLSKTAQGLSRAMLRLQAAGFAKGLSEAQITAIGHEVALSAST